MGVILMVALPGKALLELIVASTLLPDDHLRLDHLPLSGGAQTTRPQGGRVQPRALRAAGRDIVALVWVLVALFVLVVPAEAVVLDLVVVGLLLVGGLFFLGLLIFDREALETEPGDVDVFKH